MKAKLRYIIYVYTLKAKLMLDEWYIYIYTMKAELVLDECGPDLAFVVRGTPKAITN